MTTEEPLAAQEPLGAEEPRLILFLLNGDQAYLTPPPGETAQELLDKLQRGELPFSGQWIEVDFGEVIRLDAIIRARVEGAGTPSGFD